MKLLILSLFLTSCVTTQQKTLKDYDLSSAIAVRNADIKKADKDKNGLLTEIKKDCDGMIWQGQWCASTGCDLVGYEDTRLNGRFYRRPQPRCWTKSKADKGIRQGSAATWSRDMFVCGFGIYALAQQRLDLLQRHVKYGQDNFFVMGYPVFAKGYDPRTTYTPNVRAYLYRALASVGGKKYPGYYWPAAYGSGSKDFHAHLQLCSIWARGISDNRITNQMKSRVEEHYKADKTDLFAAYLHGKYTGNYKRIHKLCSSSEMVVPKYVRCGKGRTDCQIAHKVFVCGMMIDDLTQ